MNYPWILLVLALACFLLSALGVSSRVRLLDLGLALLTASFLSQIAR